MGVLVDLLVDALESVLVKYVATKTETSAMAKLIDSGFKTFAKIKKNPIVKGIRTALHPDRVLKSKLKQYGYKHTIGRDVSTDTLGKSGKEIKNWDFKSITTLRKIDTFRERFDIKGNDLYHNDLHIKLNSGGVEFLIGRAISKNSVYGGLIMKVKNPSKVNPSGIYTFPPIMSLRQARAIEDSPYTSTFLDEFYTGWRHLYPRQFFKEKSIPQQYARNGNTITDLSLRLNWDTDPFAKKMRILISKYHSNYLSGYGKFNKYKTPHMNPLTKIYTANEPQWHRLEGNKRLYRTYVSRTRRRVINKELTKFKKAHPLLKKIPKKIRKQTNKGYTY